MVGSFWLASEREWLDWSEEWRKPQSNEGGQKISGDFEQRETMGSGALQMEAPRKQSQWLQEPLELGPSILDINRARLSLPRGLL